MKEASATWSEDVTINGFKACIMVANRHLHSEFENLPSIHWTVFQSEFFSNDDHIKSGLTWLNPLKRSTQCKIIESVKKNTKFQIYTSLQSSDIVDGRHSMTVWTEIVHGPSLTNYVKVCTRNLHNDYEIQHKGVIVVSI